MCRQIDLEKWLNSAAYNITFVRSMVVPCCLWLAEEEPQRDERHGERDQQRGDHGAGEAGEPPGLLRRVRRGEPELEEHDAREVGEREEHEDDGDGGVDGGAGRRVGPTEGLEQRLDDEGDAERHAEREPGGRR